PHFLNNALINSGPHINRLCDFQFLGNLRLFERSEFSKLPLRKLKQSKEQRFNWGVFSLPTFFYTSKRK
ncbi:hypothetical protein, partial [Haemophilus influenzae]|uniref:hypothetical protein n=1 Tax=Haemophilus influenzae TaxID=727 RepID=UPI00278C1737